LSIYQIKGKTDKKKEEKVMYNQYQKDGTYIVGSGEESSTSFTPAVASTKVSGNRNGAVIIIVMLIILGGMALLAMSVQSASDKNRERAYQQFETQKQQMLEEYNDNVKKMNEEYMENYNKAVKKYTGR
jgi:hypothetical protein